MCSIVLITSSLQQNVAVHGCQHGVQVVSTRSVVGASLQSVREFVEQPVFFSDSIASCVLVLRDYLVKYCLPDLMS